MSAPGKVASPSPGGGGGASVSPLEWLKNKKFDYLRCAGNDTLIRFFDKNKSGSLESVQFSDEVIKINKRGRNQKRELIITNMSVYNFEQKKYKSCQREIAISKLRGIVLSTTSDEVLIQVKNDYCYRFLIVRKADVITCLAHFYETTTGQRLPISSAADLGKHQVLKEDVKRGGREDEKIDDAKAPAKSPASPAPKSETKSGSGITVSVVTSGSSGSGTSGSAGSSGAGGATSSGTSGAAGDDGGADEAHARMEGWLGKRGVVNNVWRRRYFRLNEANMLYYEPKLKSTFVIDGGEVRAWTSKRGSIPAKGAGAGAETRAPSESIFTQPHYLRNILANAARAESFVKYCNSVFCAEGAKFYLGVDAYRRLPEGKERGASALRLFETYIKHDAVASVSLPSISRDLLIASFEAKGFVPELRTFDDAQFHVLKDLTANILPGYMEAQQTAAAASAARPKAEAKSAAETFVLKTALTEDDKKVAKCQNCDAGFTLIRRKHWCRYCGDVFCAPCVTKTCLLPPAYQHREPVRVCDLCHSTLESNNHPHAFSYVSARRTVLNLAAADAGDMTGWIAEFQRCITILSKAQPQKERDIELKAVHKEGWLMREDPATKAWRKRYFVLDHDKLYHYELVLKGSMALTEGAGVHATTQVEATISKSEGTTGGLTTESNFAHRFTISHKARLYALAADTQERMLAWIEALERTLRKPKKEGVEVKKKAVVSLEQYTASFNEEAPVGEVTFVFTDVQSSTKLWETAPTGMNKGLEAHDALLRLLLKKFRGYEVKTEGDAFMVTFFNSLDAILWCIAVQRGLLDLTWPDELLRLPYSGLVLGKDGRTPVFSGIRIRMGIHVGHPACRRNPVTGRMDYFGPVVNRSARVSDSGHGGQVICTEEVLARLTAAQTAGTFTQELIVEHLGAFPYKGISEPVKVWQLTAPDMTERNPFPALRLEKGEKEKKPEGKEEEEEESEEEEEVDEEQLGEFDEVDDEDAKEEKEIAAKVAQHAEEKERTKVSLALSPVSSSRGAGSTSSSSSSGSAAVAAAAGPVPPSPASYAKRSVDSPSSGSTLASPTHHHRTSSGAGGASTPVAAAARSSTGGAAGAGARRASAAATAALVVAVAAPLAPSSDDPAPGPPSDSDDDDEPPPVPPADGAESGGGVASSPTAAVSPVIRRAASEDFATWGGDLA